MARWSGFRTRCRRQCWRGWTCCLRTSAGSSSWAASSGARFAPLGSPRSKVARPRHVQQLCEDLADRDLIRPAEGDRYSFRHILIQEVAYGTLPRSERARLHAEAARWVESNAGQREVALAEILAFHYREAAVLYTALEPGSELTALIRDKAAQWLLRATDVAV